MRKGTELPLNTYKFFLPTLIRTSPLSNRALALLIRIIKGLLYSIKIFCTYWRNPVSTTVDWSLLVCACEGGGWMNKQTHPCWLTLYWLCLWGWMVTKTWHTWPKVSSLCIVLGNNTYFAWAQPSLSLFLFPTLFPLALLEAVLYCTVLNSIHQCTVAVFSMGACVQGIHTYTSC